MDQSINTSLLIKIPAVRKRGHSITALPNVVVEGLVSSVPSSKAAWNIIKKESRSKEKWLTWNINVK